MGDKLRIIYDFDRSGDNYQTVEGEVLIRMLSLMITIDTFDIIEGDLKNKLQNPEDEVFKGIDIAKGVSNNTIEMYESYLENNNPEAIEELNLLKNKILKTL